MERTIASGRLRVVVAALSLAVSLVATFVVADAYGVRGNRERTRRLMAERDSMKATLESCPYEWQVLLLIGIPFGPGELAAVRKKEREYPGFVWEWRRGEEKVRAKDTMDFVSKYLDMDIRVGETAKTMRGMEYGPVSIPAAASLALAVALAFALATQSRATLVSRKGTTVVRVEKGAFPFPRKVSERALGDPVATTLSVGPFPWVKVIVFFRGGEQVGIPGVRLGEEERYEWLSLGTDGR